MGGSKADVMRLVSSVSDQDHPKVACTREAAKQETRLHCCRFSPRLCQSGFRQLLASCHLLGEFANLKAKFGPLLHIADNNPQECEWSECSSKEVAELIRWEGPEVKICASTVDCEGESPP
jgi:hypothetical protein